MLDKRAEVHGHGYDGMKAAGHFAGVLDSEVFAAQLSSFLMTAARFWVAGDDPPGPRGRLECEGVSFLEWIPAAGQVKTRDGERTPAQNSAKQLSLDDTPVTRSGFSGF